MQIPPGRAGRLWLQRRLEAAERSADVLDQKRQALVELERSLAKELRSAEAAWEAASRDAGVWLSRALTLSGPARLDLVAHYTPAAHVDVRRQNRLGVRYPAMAEVQLPPQEDTTALGGSSAVHGAVEAHRQALSAGAELARARTAHAAVEAELASVVRRRRAIERRWVPRHERALDQLELSLDEGEREDLLRLLWFTGEAQP